MKKYYKFKDSIAILDFATIPPYTTEYSLRPFPVTAEGKINYDALAYIYDPHEITEEEFNKWKSLWDDLDEEFNKFKEFIDSAVSEMNF